MLPIKARRSALWQAIAIVTTARFAAFAAIRRFGIFMLAFIRKTLTSLPVLILLGVLLIAFAVTGIGDPFGGGSAPKGSVAKVGGKTISEPDLLAAFDRVMRNARQQNPSVSQVQLAREGAVPAVANQLIGQTALEALAHEAGLGASDRAIGGVIGGIEAFQVAGKFDDATYRRVIGQQRLSDRELHEGIAGDILRRQLIVPVTAALGVPAGMAEPYARLLVDAHRGGVAIVPLGQPTLPSDAEIASYYAANTLKFTLPERRAFRYARVDRDTIAAGVTISDADIAAAFAKDPAKYGAAATRKLAQVVVPDEAKAKAIADAARSEGFAAAAKRLAGFADTDIALGDQSQAQFGAATNADVAKAAFALPVGGISAPIKSDFGWHVVKVEALGSAGKTLAQARPAIEAELKKQRTDQAVADIVARIEDGVDAGKGFADLAKATGLVLVSQPPVTIQGVVAPGASPASADLPAIAAKAFRHEPDDGAAVEDLGGGKLVAIETTQVLAPAPQPLADVRAAVAAGAAQDKAMRSAKARADAVVAAVRAGKDFTVALAAQGLPAPQPLAGRRIDITRQQNVPQVVTAFLALPAGAMKAFPSPQGWVLIHVDSVTPGDPKAVPGLVDAGRRELATGLPDEFGAAFAAAAERSVGVKRNDATIAAVTRRLSGLDN